MRFAIIPLLTLFIHTASAQRDTVLVNGKSCESGNWKLVWVEDFNETTLNATRWFTYYPYTDDGSDNCAFCRLHGDGGQVYIDENVVVSDGILKLIVKQEPIEWFGEQRLHSSGMIHSKQYFGYGRFEIRAKLPDGKGLWPAIWLFGKHAAELDIMEAGMQKPGIIHTSIHNYKIGRMKHLKHRRMPDLSKDYHNYIMEWDTNSIVFMLDEQVLWRFNRFVNKRNYRQLESCNLEPGEYGLEPLFPPVNEQLQLILNVTVGTKTTPFTKEPDKKTVFPATMEVDWIKIYKRDN